MSAMSPCSHNSGRLHPLIAVYRTEIVKEASVLADGLMPVLGRHVGNSELDHCHKE